MTPMMQQLQAARDQHPGMVVLFQNGEFFELFGDDAELGHRVLGLTLTKREETPMAGFPLAKLDHHLRQMLSAGHRVAVVEQMDPPTDGKKIIRREVTRVVTLGTITEDELLDPRRPNHLTAVVRSQANLYGVAWVDLSAGTFSAADLDEKQLPDEFARLNAAECLLSEDQAVTIRPLIGAVRGICTRPNWTFDAQNALETLKKQFNVTTLAGFGFVDRQPCLIAAGALLQYLQETVKASLGHLRRITLHRPDSFLVLDEVTRRSLELTRTLRDNQRDGSLLSMIDRTVTAMGARFLHDNLLAPLNSIPAIDARLDAVEEFLMEHSLRGELRGLLDATSDLHRLTTRVSTARANPKDLGAIARTLHLLPKLKAKLTSRRSALVNELEQKLELVPDIRLLLETAIVDDPPYSPKEGGVIREGFHAELDELKRLSKDGKDWIARYQAAEMTRTGINSLKVGFTDVMGYYIEITNANESRVPSDYIHERTLKNAKRYITPKLKEYEEKVLTAQDKSRALEFELFLQVRDRVAAETNRLMQTADVLAMADFLSSMAELASGRNYVRPKIVPEPTLDIIGGRHPVLDQLLPPGTFVPNDTRLSEQQGKFWLVTGPNMAGKSTFLRQTALITLLTHIGSFVPAKTATIGVTDRIFTRVGASDELSRGQSTFMVEMTEAANILHNASPQSLVILDEIGRGTATYDGVSLAWAMTEYLHDHSGCRALFATHYHELAQLERTLPRLRNYTVQVRELENEVIFLHTIAPGSAGKSYGIHVARLAGVPEKVLARATEVLSTLERQPESSLKPPVVQPAVMPPKTKRIALQPIVVEPPEGTKQRIKPTGPNLFGDE
jgi:DNA mismatch repair protein MutS